jgi:putative oxidoreductase
MIKTVLLILLGLFFILNGLNHLFNRLTLEEYAHRRQLMSPRIIVFLSGLLLIFDRHQLT